ncbi:MFS transporter [Mycobacterium sp. pUA109]|uniref:MFS transporter n=1 Tax=Mycobacterium sp. pUA109 TaxID=3238982 RepID=UPI00351BD3E3
MNVRRFSPAFKFVLMVGVMSFFADLTYEASRSILGQFLGMLGAGALAIAVITGFGELLGYGLRLVSGRGADRTGAYWPITIAGYILQMSVVPLLALAGSWQVAAVLVIAERVGKAIRNPPRDAMLSHAATQMGYGWGFGVHEALDQFGAMVGPLVIAVVLARNGGDYRLAFAALAVPAVIMLSLLAVARRVYPRPQDLESAGATVRPAGLPRVFWIYLLAAAMVASGFADFPMMAYHFQRAGTVSATYVPLFYAAAMAVSGTGSLVFGRLFDRFGIRLLIPLTLTAAIYAPLIFLGGFWPALLGSCLWGLGMGVHESIIPAAVAPMVSPSRRASAYGVFTGVYGVAWFAGSAAIGALFGLSMGAVVTFAVAVQLIALPFLLRVARDMPGTQPGPPAPAAPRGDHRGGTAIGRTAG